jgi:hypothetical protein
LDNLSTNQQWTLESYKLYSSMASIPELKKIVELRPCTIVTTGDIEGNMIYESKLRWLQENNIPGFRRSTDLFNEYGLNTQHSGGLTEAYEYTAPVINVDLAMGFLLDLVKSKGAALRTETIFGDLLDQESELLKTYKADAIVNAMGIGASEAAADPNVYGLHGALLRLVNDGTDFPVVENAIIVSSVKAGASGGEGAFILPRQDKILALGTISQSKGEAADLTVDSPEVKEMRARCEDLLPCLKNGRLDTNYPILHGTRPQRKGGVRVQHESRRANSRIVHSYGHGGAGWSLAVGSAKETIRLVSEVLSQIPMKVTIENTIIEKVDIANKQSSTLVQGTF